MSILNSFLVCMSLYSTIPMVAPNWETGNTKYTFCFIPFIGLIIGVVAYLLAMLMVGFTSVFSAVVVMAVPIIISGGIHLDGLVDTCDGIFSYGDKEKRLQILSDPLTGAVGVIGCVTYTFLIFGGYVEVITQNKFLVLLVPIFAISRSVGVLGLLTIESAKKDGLGRSFVDMASKKTCIVTNFIWLMCGMGFVFYINALMGVIFIIAGILFFCWYRNFIRKTFGGITGDLTGFLIMAMEFLLVMLVAVGGKFA
ncbi:MAG: adenosylcobinamide-GDP ribazoletransferase [Anaerotignaceae bacterium]